MTSAAIEVDTAYAECQAITRREARNFYYAFVTLPKERRRSIYAAYAFSRLADDIADGDGDAAERGQALTALRGSLHAAFAGAPTGAIMTALADTAHAYLIPESLFNDIIDGVEMDLTRSRYATFEELKGYCYRVASAVGLVSIHIFGFTDDRAKDYAVDLGLAMQLTNIMRDVAEDAALGRIYLPQDELARFGVSEEQLRDGMMDDHFVALMRFQAERARGYFASGSNLFPLLSPRSRGCATGLHHLYAKLLDRIERKGFDVFQGRISLPKWEKLRLTFTLWAASYLPRRQPN
jgi:phytoene synthase